MRAPCALLLLVAVIGAVPAGAAADQASQPASPSAAHIAAGRFHTCAVLAGAVRCWGYGGDGALGYGNTDSIGDDETPGSVGPVDLGPGRTAKAISTGNFHTCALLDDGTVRCWGFGGDGRLGYASTSSIGASQTPGSVGPVDLGPGRTATAITAGGAHTCAVLDDGTVRCWGSGFDGRLGYGSTENVGDVQTPGSAGPVRLGPGRATAISAGGAHTCALIDNGSVRCWGFGASGQLGYGNGNDVGDTPSTTPDTAGPVDLGAGHTAKAISAGGDHTCAVLDDDSVSCWGFGASGRLGYGNADNVGSTPTTTPASVGPVDLGPGRTAKAISSASGDHTCAVLDDDSVRCWGSGAFGQLGYADTNDVGERQTPGSVGPVDLGAGRSAAAITTGDLHTCAMLDDASTRCWGYGANGRLGSCNQRGIGDDETPGSVAPVDLGTSNAGCAGSTGTPGSTGAAATGGGRPEAPAGGPGTASASRGGQPVTSRSARAARAQALRELKFGSCRAAAASRPKPARARARTACIKRHGRTPGRITRLSARAISGSRIVLTFAAPGSDGSHAPAARAYLVKQSRRPIRRSLRRAQTLCKGSCRFAATTVGAKIDLTVTGLRPHSTYYYRIAARDNVSNKLGPRSPTVKIRTR